MWILTFVILFSDHGQVSATTVSQEYSAQSTCEAALQTMREKLNARGAMMLTSCTRK